MRHAVRLLIGLCLTISIAACSKRDRSQSSGLTIQLPTTSGSQIMSAPAPVTSQSATWGLSDPSSSAQLTCFAVFVELPEALGNGNVCTTSTSDVIARPAFAGGLYPPGASISMIVPSGPKRRIMVIGFAASSTAECLDFQANNMNHNNLSAPFVVGELTTDLSGGDQNVVLTASMTGATKFNDCQGPLFNRSTPTGTAPTLTTIKPGGGPLTGTNTLALIGSGFTSAGAVTVGGQPCTSVTLVNSSKMTCVVPSGSSGTVPVVLTMSDGSTYTSPTPYIYTNATPTISFASSSSAVLEGQTATVSVELSHAIVSPVSLTYTIYGTASATIDTSLPSYNGTITIPALAGSNNITFSVFDDATTEGSETVVFSMMTPSGATLGATSTHTVTINDASATPSTVNFLSSSLTVSEGGLATISLTISPPSASSIYVPFVYSGSAATSADYTPSSGLTISPGSNTVSFTIPIVDDSTYETTESMILTMGAVSGGVAGANSILTAYIIDNDSAPTIGFASPSTSNAEANSPFIASLVLSAASALPVTVDYAISSGTANVGTDVGAQTGTLTIAAGSVSASISASIVNDIIPEPNETFYITLTNPLNAGLGTATMSITILDNDPYVVQGDGGYDHTCIALSDGAIKCWGSNFYGQLGNSSTIASLTPVTTTISGATQVSAGNAFTCAVISGGAYCWGLNTYGQLGDGTTVSRTSPTPVSGLASGVTQVEAGDSFSCGLLSGGTVKCWGLNGAGQLGNNSNTNSSTPVIAVSSGATALTVGTSHACAVVSSSIQCWGYGSNYRNGSNSAADFLVPTAIYNPSSYVFVEVSAGGAHSCMRVGAGSVYCIGLGSSGQVGAFTDQSSPFPISSLTGTSIATGTSFSCAVTVGGTVSCWGDQQYGALGNGVSTGSTSTPQPATGITGSGLDSVIKLFAGNSFACGIFADHRLSCWGQNTSGQLGTGDNTNRLVPTNIVYY